MKIAITLFAIIGAASAAGLYGGQLLARPVYAHAPAYAAHPAPIYAPRVSYGHPAPIYAAHPAPVYAAHRPALIARPIYAAPALSYGGYGHGLGGGLGYGRLHG